MRDERWSIRRTDRGWVVTEPDTGWEVSFSTWDAARSYVAHRSATGAASPVPRTRKPRRRPPTHKVRRRGTRKEWAVMAFLAAVLLGSTGAGTYAFWNDTSTVPSGTLTSGSMDMQLSADGSAWGAVGLGTAFSASHITASSITPTESYAFVLHVKNVGDPNFTYVATATQGAGWTFVSNPITVRFFAGGTPSVDTTYPIQRTCAGGTPLTAAVTVTSSNSAVISTARALAVGASEQLCVEVAMASGADSTNQGKTGTLRFDFTATQATP